MTRYRISELLLRPGGSTAPRSRPSDPATAVSSPAAPSVGYSLPKEYVMGNYDSHRQEPGLRQILDDIPAALFIAEMLRLTVIEYPAIRTGLKLLKAATR